MIRPQILSPASKRKTALIARPPTSFRTFHLGTLGSGSLNGIDQRLRKTILCHDDFNLQFTKSMLLSCGIFTKGRLRVHLGGDV